MPKNKAEEKGSNFVYRMIKANQIESKSKELNLNNSKFSSNNKTTKDSNNKMNSYSNTSQISVHKKKVKCKGEKVTCCFIFK